MRMVAWDLAEETLRNADTRQALRGFIDFFADNALLFRRLLEPQRCLIVEQRLLCKAVEDCLCRLSARRRCTRPRRPPGSAAARIVKRPRPFPRKNGRKGAGVLFYPRYSPVRRVSSM